MYAIYTYAAGSTQANVLADLVKLITGETNKANLSANCVQASTSILSTVAAGWAVYDAAAGTNKQMMRVLNQDASTYKYMSITMSSTASFVTGGAEAWNSGTHTGTNETAGLAAPWDATNGGTFYVYATPKNVLIQSYSGSVFRELQYCMEFSRDTVPSAYPCTLHSGSTGSGQIGSGATSQYPCYVPRTKKNTTTGDATVDLQAMHAVGGGYGNPVISNSQNVLGVTQQLFRDAAETVKLAIYKIGVGAGAFANGCQLGTCYDLYLTGVNSGINTLDEITYSSTTYVAVKLAACVLLFPKA